MTIEVTNVSFSYGRMKVLDTISATAQRGRITTVLGPNAAGKSTLLRCIIGAARPSSGSIRLDGRDVISFNERELAKRMAYVPQRATVSAAFSVRQVVELGRYSLEPSPSAVDHALQSLDLQSIENRPYPKLSVGQQQRVTLARALAQLGPSGVMVLDEPFSAMDLQHISACIQLLSRLADRGATIIMATHDLTLAAAMANDAWLLQDGRAVAVGAVNDVLTPLRLEEVFRTRFEWVVTKSGHRRLQPELSMPDRQQAATIEPL